MARLDDGVRRVAQTPTIIAEAREPDNREVQAEVHDRHVRGAVSGFVNG